MSSSVGVAHSHAAGLSLILLAHATLLAWEAWSYSPTANEAAFLPAGISHWEFGRFELYRVNPPLVRMIAALPVLMAGYETDWSGYSVWPGSRPEATVGRDFVAANKTRSVLLFRLARLACIPLSLIGAAVSYAWARALYGSSAAFAAVVLWVFSPTLLAHGSLITPDAAAAAFGLAAGFSFWRWLRDPSWVQAFFAGLVLGMAQITKFTCVILFAVWPACWVVCRSMERIAGEHPRSLHREGGQLAAILLSAVVLVNASYGFDGTLCSLGDFRFVSRMLNGKGASWEPGNRFSEGALASCRLPFPKHYILGMDLQMADLESPGYPSYLRGQWRDNGWWYYYLYGLLIKVPLGTIILLLIAIASGFLTHSLKFQRSELILILVPIVVITVVSAHTHLNHHVRYVLPATGFLFVLSARVFTQGVLSRPRMMALVFLLNWSVGSSLWVYPHSLSYFNELVGGPYKGRLHLLGSNVDWGQDLLYLRRWISSNRERKELTLVYWGGLDPRDLGIEAKCPAESKDRVIASLPSQSCWYAVSVNFLSGAQGAISVDYAKWAAVPAGSVSWLRDCAPAAAAGYSILIYHVTQEEANRARRDVGSPDVSAEVHRK